MEDCAETTLAHTITSHRKVIVETDSTRGFSMSQAFYGGLYNQTRDGEIEMKTLWIGCAAVAMASLGSAQWLDYPTAGIPRDAKGKPNLSAPLPKKANGQPDLSGIW